MPYYTPNWKSEHSPPTFSVIQGGATNTLLGDAFMPTPIFDYQSLVESLDEAGASVLAACISLHEFKRSFTREEIEKESGRTYSVTLKRLKDDLEPLLESQKKPNPKAPNLSPLMLYSFKSWVDLTALKQHLGGDEPSHATRKPGHPNTDQAGMIEAITASDVENFFAGIQPAARAGHARMYELLLCSDHLSGLTVTEMSLLNGEEKSTNHSRLMRSGVLTGREKRSGQFYYFINPEIDKEMLKRVLEKYASNSAFSNQQQLVIEHPHLSGMDTMDTQSSDQSANVQQSSSGVLEKLMLSFDPSWPKDWQAIWFEGLRQITQKTKN